MSGSASADKCPKCGSPTDISTPVESWYGPKPERKPPVQRCTNKDCGWDASMEPIASP